MPAAERRLGIGLAVVLLTLAALGARLRGSAWLLPGVTHLDASVVVYQSETLRSGDEAAREKQSFRYYPLLLARTVALLPDPGRTEPRPGLSTDEHVALASARWQQVREVSACWSVLLVPATFLLARTFLPAGWALFAAALVATSLLHAVFGTQARPHGIAASWGLLSVLASIRLRDRGDVASFLVAGVAAGLAIGALQYGIFVLPPLALAFLLRRRRAPWWWIAVAGGLVLAIVYWTYPFHFESGGTSEDYLTVQERDGEKGLNISGQLLKFEKFNGKGFPVIPETLWSYDPTILFLSLGGVAALVARRRRAAAMDPDRRARLWIALAHALPYALVIGMYDETWERFVMVLLPYLALLGAAGARAVAGRAARFGPAAVPAVALLLLAPAAALVWHLGTVRSAPSTFDETAGWIERDLEPGRDRVLVLGFDLPVMHSREALIENREVKAYSLWVRYQLGLTEAERRGVPRYTVLLPTGKPAELVQRLRHEPLAYVREKDAHYVVVEEIEPSVRGHFTAARDALRAHAPPVFRTTSERTDRGPAPLPNIRIADSDWSLPYVARLAASERMGPALEVYRVPLPRDGGR